MSAYTLSDLRAVDLFDDLSDDELAQWVEVARPHDHKAGEILAEQGVEVEGVLLLLEGTAL